MYTLTNPSKKAINLVPTFALHTGKYNEEERRENSKVAESFISLLQKKLQETVMTSQYSITSQL